MLGVAVCRWWSNHMAHPGWYGRLAMMSPGRMSARPSLMSWGWMREMLSISSFRESSTAQVRPSRSPRVTSRIDCVGSVAEGRRDGARKGPGPENVATGSGGGVAGTAVERARAAQADRDLPRIVDGGAHLAAAVREEETSPGLQAGFIEGPQGLPAEDEFLGALLHDQKPPGSAHAGPGFAGREEVRPVPLRWRLRRFGGFG